MIHKELTDEIENYRDFTRKYAKLGNAVFMLRKWEK